MCLKYGSLFSISCKWGLCMFPVLVRWLSQGHSKRQNWYSSSVWEPKLNQFIPVLWIAKILKEPITLQNRSFICSLQSVNRGLFSTVVLFKNYSILKNYLVRNRIRAGTLCSTRGLPAARSAVWLPNPIKGGLCWQLMGADSDSPTHSQILGRKRAQIGDLHGREACGIEGRTVGPRGIKDKRRTQPTESTKQDSQGLRDWGVGHQWACRSLTWILCWHSQGLLTVRVGVSLTL